MSASLSARTSLTPSPVIDDGVTAGLQRVHHRPLLVRTHPAEGGVLAMASASAPGSFGQSRASRVSVQAQRSCHRPTDTALSPEITFTVTCWEAKYSKGVAGVRANALLENDERDGVTRPGRHRRRRCGPTPPVAAPASVAPICSACAAAGSPFPAARRGADHPVAVFGVGGAAPLAGDLNRATAVGGPSGDTCGYASAIACMLALGRGRRRPTPPVPHRPACRSPPLPARLSARRMPFSVRFRSCRRRRRRRRPNPRSPGSSCTRHLRRPSRTTPTAKAMEVIRTRALRDHRDQCADHPQHRFPPADVGEEQLGVDDQQSGGPEQIGDELQDSVDATAQGKFGSHQGELAGLLGQAARRPHGPPWSPGRRPTTKLPDITGSPTARLRDRIGLPVSSDSSISEGAGLQFPVHDDLVSGAEFDHVVEHDPARRCRTAAAPWVSLTHDGPGCPASSWPVTPECADGAVGDRSAVR